MKLFHIIITICLVYSSNVYSTDYYISETGNDSNSGISQFDPFLTIQAAADIVVAGDHVWVASGTYAGFDVRDVDGTEENPIIFEGFGTGVIINEGGPLRNDCINVENADWVIIDTFTCNDAPGNGNGVRIVLSNNCIVRNCFCDNNAERGIFTAFTDDVLIENNVCSNSIDEHGIYVSNSSDRPIIRYNECFGNNNIGIHVNGDLSAGGDGIISNAQVYNNFIHDNNQGAGINMDGLENPIIYNNVITNNHSSQGIALFQQDGAIVTSGAKIYNNTIVVPDDGRWGILLDDGAQEETEIYNNIIVNLHDWRGCISAENSDGLISDFNILNDKNSNDGDGYTISLVAWQALGFDLNSLLADPISEIFNDTFLNDYSLIGGSQAIDSGTDLVSGIVTIDFLNLSRPISSGYDIGAYEYNYPIGIEELQIDQLTIYPNPANHYFNLNLASNRIQKVNIINNAGRVVKTVKLESRINISDLTTGLYLIEIVQTNNTINYKKLRIN